MTPLPIEIHPDATVEASEARIWYAMRSNDAGVSFADEVDRAVERIARSPGAFPVYLHGTRSLRPEKFPYLVIYRQLDFAIQVVAIAHGRRRPGYWRDRR